MKFTIAALIVFGLVLTSDAKKGGHGGKGRGRGFCKFAKEACQDETQDFECENGRKKFAQGKCSEYQAGSEIPMSSNPCQDAAIADEVTVNVVAICVVEGQRPKVVADPFNCQDLTITATCEEGRREGKLKPTGGSCQTA